MFGLDIPLPVVLAIGAFIGIVVITKVLGSGKQSESSTSKPETKAVETAAVTPAPGVLQNEWVKFPIVAVIQVSHNVKRLRFALPDPSITLGIKIGDHCRVRFMKNGEEVARSYTPCSTPSQKGTFEIIFKVYPTGGVSQYMDGLKMGDLVEIRRRPGTLKYGSLEWGTKVALISGGTGITPMLQFVHNVLENTADTTKMVLITANSTIDDVLLEAELEAIRSAHPERLTVVYAVSKPPEGWSKGFVGRINPQLLASHGIKAGETQRVLLCGPEGFVSCGKEAAVANGFQPTQIYVF